MKSARGKGPPVGYGIDLGAKTLTVVRARRTRKGIQHEVILDQASLSGDLRTAPGITELQANLIGGNAQANAGIAAGEGFVRWLQTPFTSNSKAARVLPSLLDLQLPFPLEQCRYTFPKLDSGPDRKVRALAVAARETELSNRLDALRDVGIDPTLLDHEALALWEYAQSEWADTSGYQLVAHLGPDRCTLVVGETGQFRSAHGLRTGLGDGIDPALQQQFCSRARHILRSQCTNTEAPIQLLWTGPGASDDLTRAGLEESLSPDRQTTFLCPPQPQAALAKALASRAVSADADAWNLRSGALEHPAIAQARGRRTTRSAIAALIAGALLIVGNVAWQSVLKARNGQLQQQIVETASEISGIPAASLPRGQEVFAVKNQLAQGGAGIGDPFARMVEPGLSYALSESAQIAYQLQLSIAGFSAADGQFSVTGSAPTDRACQNYVKYLAGRDLTVTLESQPNRSDERIGFTIRGNYHGS